MHILYLEDNPLDADLTRLSLQDALPDVKLDVAGTLMDASQLLLTHMYDAVLVDMRLPDGSGTEFIAEIRRHDLRTPLVVLTGSDDEAATVSALKAGADDYILKNGPYLVQLPDVLCNAIERRHQESARHARALNVIYVEHFETDADLTQRHFKQYAPHIQLHVIFSGDTLLQMLKGQSTTPLCDVLLLDYRLPGLNALELLKMLRERFNVDIPVVLITGQGSVDIAVQALRMGASDYVVKQKGYLQKLPYMLENAYNLAELERQRSSLEQALEKQAHLMRELFHRTRNNMQVISSIIELQSMLIHDETASDICLKTQQRVKAMAMVQELLYENQQLSTVDLDTYLMQLCKEMQRSNHIPDDRIQLLMDLENVNVHIDIAVPCGLILNELVMNAYQHAFPNDRSGTITVSLHRTSENELHLIISDDGVGVPNGFDMRKQRTFGLQAVIMIAEYQLQGRVEVNTATGFSSSIYMRDDLYLERI